MTPEELIVSNQNVPKLPVGSLVKDESVQSHCRVLGFLLVYISTGGGIFNARNRILEYSRLR